MADKRAFTSARGLFFVDGPKGAIQIGYCTGVNGNEIIARRPIRPIGQVRVAEFPVVGVDVQFSASYVRIVGEDEVEMSLLPPGRDTKDWLDEQPVRCYLMDMQASPEPKPFMVIHGAVPTGNSWGMMSGDVVSGTINFSATHTMRESELPG